MSSKQSTELAAFCETCPSPQEVIQALAALGFRLAFQMEEQVQPAYVQEPPIPAQFHFRDRHGTEVIFLAGVDTGEEGEYLPPHKARFWAYPGSLPVAALTVTQTLAARWRLSWRRTGPAGSSTSVA